MTAFIIIIIYLLCIYLPKRKVTPVTVSVDSDSNTQFSWKMHFTKWLLQGIKPHVVNHGILTKLTSLIHLYSSFFFFYNSLTTKQLSTKAKFN